MTSIYRQIAWKLRWHTVDGADRWSERPRETDGMEARYLDLPPRPPTLVEFGPGDRVDVNDLLRMGAIAPHDPAKGG